MRDISCFLTRTGWHCGTCSGALDRHSFWIILAVHAVVRACDACLSDNAAPDLLLPNGWALQTHLPLDIFGVVEKYQLLCRKLLSSKLFFPEIFPLRGLFLLSFLQRSPKRDFPQKRKMVMKVQSVLPFGSAAVLPGKSCHSSASRSHSPAPQKEATDHHGPLAPTGVPAV